MTVAQSILLFLWGAFTAVCWFLAWNHLGAESMHIPNGFLALAIISTLFAASSAVVAALDE